MEFVDGAHRASGSVTTNQELPSGVPSLGIQSEVGAAVVAGDGDFILLVMSVRASAAGLIIGKTGQNLTLLL